MILIVGTFSDPHLTRVAERLRTLNADVFIFDHYAGHALTVTLDGDQSSAMLLDHNRSINLNEVKTVWWRLKPFTIEDVNESYPNLSDAFRAREWRSAFGSLAAMVSETAFWINPLDAQHRARSKMYQLLQAVQAGFAIPNTRLTNDARSVATLFGHKNGVIFKPQNPVFPTPGTFVYTTKLDQEDILNNIGSIAAAPGIYQSLELKDHELRITIVGEEIFAARIDAPRESLAAIDWRRAQDADIYVRTTLTVDCTRRLLQLHRALGLYYATYDLIVRPDGDVIFLECNPAGGYLGIETRLGFQISNCIASALNDHCLREGMPA